ncbi:MAG: hypothetical protein ACPGVU_21830 [Limisphaerales bacterium]
MNCFTQLIGQPDEPTLLSYFRTASSDDAVWAVWLLLGNRPRRSVSTVELKDFVADETGFPVWLVEESHRAASDWGETAALLLDTAGVCRTDPGALSLDILMRERLMPLVDAAQTARRKLLGETWRELSLNECRVFHKLLNGSFRSVFAPKLLARSLASIAGVEYPVMAYRMTRNVEPRLDAYQALIAPFSEADAIGAPCPFRDLRPMGPDPSMLGEVSDWRVERKWGCLRVQLIKRRGEALLWSEEEEFVTASFPEISGAGRCLPDGTVLIGEIVGRSGGMILVVQEVLEPAGECPEHVFSEWIKALDSGREMLQGDLFAEPQKSSWPITLTELLDFATWEDVKAEVDRSRKLNAVGVLLTQSESTHGWIWKTEPLTVKAILIAAQSQEGMYADYTFGVWDEKELVSIGKGGLGLTGEEISEIDAFVRDNTIQNRGPVRMVEPKLVFELACDGVRESKRHQSGLALRNPRISQWLRNCPISNADTARDLRQEGV